MSALFNVNVGKTPLFPSKNTQKTARNEQKTPVFDSKMTAFSPVKADIFIRFGSQDASQPQRTDDELRALLSEMRAKSSGHPGGLSGRTSYLIITQTPFSASEARRLQALSGFHPAGYDFMGFRSDKTDDGSYISTWRRSNSCD